MPSFLYPMAAVSWAYWSSSIGTPLLSSTWRGDGEGRRLCGLGPGRARSLQSVLVCPTHTGSGGRPGAPGVWPCTRFVCCASERTREPAGAQPGALSAGHSGCSSTADLLGAGPSESLRSTRAGTAMAFESLKLDLYLHVSWETWTK